MTRAAVSEGFEFFLEDVIEATLEEFSVARALRNGAGPGGAVVDRLLKNSGRLHRQVVQPELEAYRRQTLAQFEVLLEYVESDADIAAYRDPILRAGPIAESIRSDVGRGRRESVEADLLAHLLEIGEAVEPLVRSPESSFWDAAAAELGREEARRLAAELFTFTDPLEANREALAMTTTVDATDVLGAAGRLLGPASRFEVEYTDEAIRAMGHGERSALRSARREIDRSFG